MFKFKLFFLFVLFFSVVAVAWDGVKVRVRVGTDQRFFTALYNPSGQKLTWAPTPGRGIDSLHEWGSDACGGRLALLTGNETEVGSFQVPADCGGKEYRVEVEEKEDGGLKLVLRSIL